MSLIFILILIGLGVAFYDRSARIVALERQIGTLIRRLDRIETAAAAVPVKAAEGIPPYIPEAPAAVAPDTESVVETEVIAETPVAALVPLVESPAPPVKSPARIVAQVTTAPPAQRAPAVEEAPAYEEPSASATPTVAQRFEALVGGKLPIWIGGIALVLAAFFLVRYSIEMGLLGPGVRCVLAALLGVALLVASEAARQIPRFASDTRVAQSLSGAAIASLYGTLYMASELYALIGPFAAFVLMTIVTALALGLSLRHGPPTAIMGLIGGFAAPFVAGTATANVTPVLVYLALLIAGLFALAVHRGWLWLALAATGGSTLWTLGLMLGGFAGASPLLGLFIVIVALGATVVVPRSGGSGTSVRLIPMIAGFIQLALFAPLVEFGLGAWLMYALLSAASLWLAWRDVRLAPAPLAALALVCVLLMAAFDGGSRFAPGVTVAAALLFAVPGHLLARHREGQPWWAILALGGSAAPLIAARLSGEALLGDFGWGAVLLLAAAPLMLLSWRSRDAARAAYPPDIAHAGGAVLAALLGCGAAAHWCADDVMPVATLGVALALAGWGRRAGDLAVRHASLLVVGLAGIYWLDGVARHPALVQAVFADGPIPALTLVAAYLLLPGLALGAMAWLHREKLADQPLRWAALALALALLLALVPAPWHVAVLAAVAASLLASPFMLPLPRFGREGVLAAGALAALSPLVPLAQIFAQSLVGETLHFPLLPPLARAGVSFALPALILGAGLWRMRHALMTGARGFAIGGATLLATAALYGLAKQPLAIADAERFVSLGFAERALLTQMLFAAAAFLFTRGPQWHRIAVAPLACALFRVIWFDLLLLNPVLVAQDVGTAPLLNFAVVHFALCAGWLWYLTRCDALAAYARWLSYAACAGGLITVLVAVRQLFQGSQLNAAALSREENYAYSAALLTLSLIWLWAGLRRHIGWLRIAGLALLTLVTLKVFLIDASALKGLLRVVSFLGLGGALIAIGWAYGRLLGTAKGAPLD